MWKSIWELFSAPFTVLFKGEIYGHPTGRNPIRYFSLWGWGLVTLLFTIFIYPLFILATVLGLVVSTRFDNDVRTNETGVEVFTKNRGVIAQYSWDEIEMIVVEFNPPFLYPELLLKNNERISLKLADQATLKVACEKNGVKFIDKVKKG